MSDNQVVADFSILTEEFAELAATAGRLARKDALEAGFSVVYVDEFGLCIEEFPDGRRFEILLDPDRDRETHRIVLREIVSSAA